MFVFALFSLFIIGLPCKSVKIYFLANIGGPGGDGCWSVNNKDLFHTSRNLH